MIFGVPEGGLLIIVARFAALLEKIAPFYTVVVVAQDHTSPKQLRNTERESQKSAFFYSLLRSPRIPAQRRFQQPSHESAGRVYRVHDIFHGEAEQEEEE